MSQWSSCDNLFNLQWFYEAIVATFETNPKDPWVIETFQWWNEYVLFIYLFFRSQTQFSRQVPGLQQKASKCKRRQSIPSHGSRPNPVDRILAQRARRAEINADYHQAVEDLGPQPLRLPVQQQPPRQHASHITEVDELNEHEPPIQATRHPAARNEDKSEPELESEEEDLPCHPSLMARRNASAPMAQDSNHPLATAIQKRVGLILVNLL